MAKNNKILINAIKSGDVRKVKALLAQGYNPNVTGQVHETPLHAAVERGHLGMVMALVEAGADVNQRLHNGARPLDISEVIAIRGNRQANPVIAYLQSNGAVGGDEEPKRSLKKKRAPENHLRVQEGLEKRAKKEAELAQAFDPLLWAGKTDEMEKRWREAPQELKKNFNFNAAFTEARRLTILRHRQPWRFRM